MFYFLLFNPYGVTKKKARSEKLARGGIEWKKNEVIQTLELLMTEDIAGDPCGDSRWTRKTTRTPEAQFVAMLVGLRFPNLGSQIPQRLERKNYALKNPAHETRYQNAARPPVPDP